MTGGPPPRRMPKPGRKAAAPVAVVEEIVEEVEEVEEAEAPSPVEGSPRSLAEVGRQDTPAAGALMNLLTPSPREGKPMDKCARKSPRQHQHEMCPHSARAAQADSIGGERRRWLRGCGCGHSSARAARRRRC